MTRRHPYRYPSHSRVASMPLSMMGWEMRKVVMWAVGALLMLFVGFQLYTFLIPPTLTLDTPTDGMKSIRRSIEVLGHTAPGVKVSVNGGIIPTNDQGQFKALLVLGDGVNTISVKSEKRYGRPRTVTRTILVEDRLSLNKK